MSFTGDRISSDQVVINLTRDLNAEFFQKKKSLAKTQKSWKEPFKIFSNLFRLARIVWTSNLVHSVRVEDEMQVTPLFRLARIAWTSNLVHSVRVEDEMQVTPLFSNITPKFIKDIFEK